MREAITAESSRTALERSHHLTAALYFGIAALEAYVNERMRAHLSPVKSEEEIFDVLRKGQIIAKLKKWPVELIGKSLSLSDEIMELLADFNDIRGDLTHPKTHGRDIYSRLETIAPRTVVDTIAEYIVRFNEAAGTRYPYWIFGWNYLNPRRDAYEIFLVNEQQFSFSLQYLGFQVPAADHFEAEAWRTHVLGTYDGYRTLRDALGRLEHCEPKIPHFPHRPVLCRRWWLAEHQRTCGNVTKEALEIARKLDEV